MSMVTQVSLENQMKSHPGLDKAAIAKLKEWNSQQTHLPKLGDADLAMFYVNNTYDMEATKKNITNYFHMRHLMPEFFVNQKDLNSSEMKQVFDTVFVVELPKRTKDNHKVILGRLMNSDAKKYNFPNAVKALNMVLDAGVYEDGPDNKYVMVYDLNGANMGHRDSLSWMGLKKFYDYLRMGSPVRFIGAHYVNSSKTNNEFQDFVKSSIVNGGFGNDNKMLQFHADMDSLMQAVGMERSMLPKEMGGEAGSAKDLQNAQMKKLESMHPVFVAMENKFKTMKAEKIPSALEVFGPEKVF